MKSDYLKCFLTINKSRDTKTRICCNYIFIKYLSSLKCQAKQLQSLFL